MELVVSGWGRDHGEKVIARRDLTDAQSDAYGGYARPEAYITTVEGKEIGPFGTRVVRNGNIELRFYAKITLNGEYLVRQTLSRKEIARLFYAQYDGCSFEELMDVFQELRERTHSSKFPSVMLKTVRELGLTEGTVAWLLENNIYQAGDLVQKTESQMQKMPDFERQAFFEIMDRLAPLGLQFGMEVQDWSAVPRLFLTRVDDLELSVRTASCLKNDDIIYIGDLVQKTDAEMLRMPNFGRKSLNEVKELLAQMDLRLGLEVKNWRRPG